MVLVGRAVEYRGLPWGDAMKIIGRFALAAVAAAGLVFATSAPAGAVDSHKHCLYIESLDRYVLIAEGLSEHAPNPPALDNFHEKVHRGEPGDHLVITRIEMDADCPARLPGSVVPAD